MATIMMVYRCLVCGYVMEVKMRHDITCPSCKAKMSFMTTVVKKD